MKTKLILNNIGLLAVMALLLMFTSCSKPANGNLSKEQKQLQDKNLEAFSVDDKDLSESDEDLTNVNYKQFYDQLSPHGEWVQVTPEEIGLKSKTASINCPESNGFSLSNLLGIKDANAESDANVEMVYVWKPSTDLAVTTVAGETPVYVPYTNGQWVNTDAGWYFKAPTPVEETTSHYGRWVNSPNAGWLWVPGRVWAPAWVDWKQNDNYVSWAPLPPSDYLTNGIINTPIIEDNNYSIVERKYFIEPDVYKYNNPYYDNGSRILISDMTGTPGIVIVNNSIIDRGPDVSVIQTVYGRNIEMVRILHVRDFNDVRYSDKEYNVFTPGFERYKNKGNTRFTVNEPKDFKNYGDWKEKKSDYKENRKENNDNNNGNGNKHGDDSHMKYNGNDNGNKHNGNDNGNGNKHDSNGNGNKHDSNGNGNKHDSNGNGNKHDSNGNGNKHDSNGNGNKHEENGNGNKSNGNDKGTKHEGNNQKMESGHF